MADVLLTSLATAAVAWGTEAGTPRPPIAPAGVAWGAPVVEVRDFAQPPVTDPPAEDASMIILARPGDFDLDGGGNPEWWIPARLGNFGTARVSRETELIGWGTVLSMDRNKVAPTSSEADEIGIILSGSIGDQTETISVRCDCSFQRPEDEPETSDEFTIERRKWGIFRVEFHSESDGAKEMTVHGIRWRSLTQSFQPQPLTPPVNWQS